MRYSEDKIAYIGIILQFSSMTLCAVIACLIIRKNYAIFITVIEEILVLDEKIKNLIGYDLDYRKILGIILIKSIWLLPITIYIYLNKEGKIFLQIFDFFGYGIPISMRYIHISTGSIIIGILKDRFTLINKLIKNIGKINQKNKLNAITSQVFGELEPIRYLIEIKAMYETLVHLTKLLLDALSWLFIISIFGCFIQCFFAFYSLLSNSYVSMTAVELLGAFAALTILMTYFYMNCYYTEIEVSIHYLERNNFLVPILNLNQTNAIDPFFLLSRPQYSF